MSDKRAQTFPNDEVDTLTLLYLQQQDLSNQTPEELVKKYLQVHKEIRDVLKTNLTQKVRY